jgi:colanic acid/amylovoran biosynthesis glycosyltransferase
MDTANALGADRPKVGHVTRSYLPRTETFIYSLLREQREFRPVVLAQRTENLDEFPIDVVVPLLARGASPAGRVGRRIRSALAGAPSTLAHRIGTEAREAGCAALHGHFGWSGYDARWARERLGLPLITTFYGRDIGLGRTDPEWRERYAELFETGDRFVCEGPAMAQQLADIGCPPEKTRIVKIGIDLARFPFAPPVRSRPLVVMQAARLVEKKGVDVAIRAFASASPRIGDSQLWIIGDGPCLDGAQKLSADLGVEHCVRFLGSVSYDEYNALLKKVHIGIQPSRTAPDGDTEGGAPTALLELQARGIPVVATTHADIPQVVARADQLAAEEDAAGIADALVRVATATEVEWLERARDGRSLVEREHDIHQTAAQIEDLYREVSGA